MSSIDPNLARTDSLLTNCDREPIHVPGTIQPHGILLVVDPVDLMIRTGGRKRLSNFLPFGL